MTRGTTRLLRDLAITLVLLGGLVGRPANAQRYASGTYIVADFFMRPLGSTTPGGHPIFRVEVDLTFQITSLNVRRGPFGPSSAEYYGHYFRNLRVDFGPDATVFALATDGPGGTFWLSSREFGVGTFHAEAAADVAVPAGADGPRISHVSLLRFQGPYGGIDAIIPLQLVPVPVAAVPEPATLGLVAAGLLLVGAVHRGRRRATASA